MSIFNPVDTVLSRYHTKHDLKQAPIDIDKLRSIFEELGYVDQIIWEKFDLKTKYILAQIKTYTAEKGAYAGNGEYARIQVSSRLNRCWTRFVLCKEMYHCIIDEDIGRRIFNTSSILKLSDYLTNSFLDTVENDEVEFLPFETEETAEILAIETLFPMELRSHYCDQYDSGEITGRQLALRFRIPEVYIHTAMGSRYYSAVNIARNQVDIGNIQPILSTT